MFDLDLKTMTVDEVAEFLLHNFRIANDSMDLETAAPSPEATKYLAAIRKMAKEDPIALADAFLGMSLEYGALEEEIEAALEWSSTFEELFGTEELEKLTSEDDAQGA